MVYLQNTCKAGTKRQSCGSGVPSCSSLPLCADDADLVDPRDTESKCLITTSHYMAKSYNLFYILLNYTNFDT